MKLIISNNNVDIVCCDTEQSKEMKKTNSDELDNSIRKIILCGLCNFCCKMKLKNVNKKRKEKQPQSVV